MKRLLPFVILILLVLAGIFSIPFLLRPESHRAEITQTLTKLLKHPVVVGPLSMSYWPPTLHVGQFAVMKESGAPALEVERIDAPLDWTALFHFQLLPTELQLQHPVLTVQREASGAWDLESWFSGSSALPTTASLPIQKISWKAGDIHAVDHFAVATPEVFLGAIDGAWDLKHQSVTTSGGFTGIGSPAQVSLTAKGQFLSAPEWSGDAQVASQGTSGTFHIEKHGATLDVKGGAPQWSLAPLLALAKFYARTSTSVTPALMEKLENWQVHVHKEGAHSTLEQTATIGGGKSEIKGRLDRQLTGPVVHLDVALKDVPADVVLAMVGESVPLTGKVTAIGQDMEMTLSTHTAATFRGRGYIEFVQGHYLVPTPSLKKLAKAKTMPYLRKKFPDLDTQGIPVDKLGVHWQATNGIMTIDDGLLVSSTMKVGWAGKVDLLQRGFDGFLRLQIHEKNNALAHLIPVKYQSQPAYGRVQGTWDEWFLRATTASKIPAATQSKLRKSISQK